MDIRLVDIEQRNPVVIAFDFECLLGRAKYVERFTEVPHLHKRNAIKRSSLRLFIPHPDLVQSFDCAVRKALQPLWTG